MPLNLSLGSFYGIDSLIDFMIVLVSILITYQSRKAYKLTNNERYKFFSWSFALIAIGFLFKIASNLTILYAVALRNPSFVSFILEELESLELIHFISFLLYKVAVLIGFITLFLIVKKEKNKYYALLFLYLALIAVLFSIYFNWIFYATVILVLMYLNIHFYENYKRFPIRNSRLVLTAFSFILASQFVYIFSGIHPLIYLIAEITIFIGFLILLINHTRIKNDKQENKVRNHKRHSKGP